jgi:hypothetical protein
LIWIKSGQGKGRTFDLYAECLARAEDRMTGSADVGVLMLPFAAAMLALEEARKALTRRQAVAPGRGAGT